MKGTKNIPIPWSKISSATIGMFFMGSSLTCLAQEPPRPEIDLSNFIQELVPVADDDIDYNELYESLFQLYANPLDLNTVTRDELSTVFILSEEQLTQFFDYRSKGPLLSLYELQAIPHFDLATIRKLLPFVTCAPEVLQLKKAFKNPTQNFLLIRTDRPIEKPKGFSPIDTTSRSNTRFAGDAWQWYIRYRYARTGNYSLGFTFEKDAGEPLSWQPKKQVWGPDFTSFHVQIQNRRRLKNLILGDYQMQAGQGMILSAGFSLGKGAEVIRTTYRSSLGLRPFTSVMEAGFFRGVAATFQLNKTIDLTTFLSAVRRDGSTTDAPDDQFTVSSLSLAGLHRTPTERGNQAIVPERNIGFHTLYKTPSTRGQLGVTILYTHYEAILQRKEDLHNLFEFKGKQNLIIGLHGDYRWKNFHFFGEAARSKSGGIGIIGGLIVPFSRTLDFTLLLRTYDRDFHSFYGKSFAEATRPINETGTYRALRYTPNKRWQFSGFYDRFQFPWLKFLVDQPSQGIDYFLHAQYTPSKRLKLYALFHEEQKEKNQPGANGTITPVLPTIRRIAVVNFEYTVPLKYNLRSRIQAGDFRYRYFSKSHGIVLVQDISWKWPKMEISARLALQLTDNYDSRQYVYEKDALYSFSVPAYYDKGTRHYLMIRRNLGKHVKVWLRWAQTRYFNLNTISSGINEIQGNTKSEVKMQLMYSF
jgi:hypothetical protein